MFKKKSNSKCTVCTKFFVFMWVVFIYDFGGEKNSFQENFDS